MSPSRIMKAGALALACASTVTAIQQYTLDPTDNYAGSNFFNMFDFWSGLDPTAGYVQYQTEASALLSTFGGPLASYSNNQAYIGVDYWNQYDPNGVGRPSVRIESKKSYTHGLFVLDLAHMPDNVCGTWPAFWTFSNTSYPSQGEIDILENIHEQTVSLETLHTAPGCTVAGNQLSNQQTDQETTYNCDDQATSSPYGSQYQYQGCSASNTNPNNYGKAFNSVGGGVYAMEWTSDVIQIWNFSPGNIPADLLAGTPDTSGWGLPAFTTAQGSCDIDSHFQDHKVVIDTTFCGNWAGQDVFWQATSCYNKELYPTCASYVAANPGAYSGAYWLINSLKVYKKTTVASSSSSSSSSSTAAPSSSSTVGSSSSSSSIPTGSSVAPSSSTSGPVYTNSSSSATVPTGSTTSTVYTTSVYTILSCAATVTNCPLNSVTTEIIPLYTTVCPIAQAAGTATSTAIVAPTTIPATTAATLPSTSVIYQTTVYTVLSCPPTVTNVRSPFFLHPSSLATSHTPETKTNKTQCPLNQVTTQILTTTAVYSPKTIIPAGPVFTYTTLSQGFNATVTAPIGSGKGSLPKGSPAGTGIGGGSQTAGVVASTSPIVLVTGAAGSLRVGGLLVVGLVGAVALML
ncbi:hypothetical protein G7Y89_g211 [Cudoniella acicularis]|uniref:GH16 domain-containing protein n=1 Tax=Cudoniella acicularis TaxID=354080 RepID=A0A8H4RZ71_9HELO|nr:hypothetical protein G7Y89_g211 [Cudoniella acicularis]